MKKIINKKYYSFHDSSIYELITPKFQHQLISLKAKEKKGEVIFYSSEDPVYNKKNRVLSQKLLEKPKVDGFILLHLKQLSYSGRIDLVLIKKIIQQKYELYFCKEDLDLLNIVDFKKNIKNFLRIDNTKKLVDLKNKMKKNKKLV